MVMSLLQGSQLRRQRAWAWAETPQVVIRRTELLDMRPVPEDCLVLAVLRR